ncbi:MAG: hypothetical protein HC765_13540 [Brachymonas sp.]|nr:hypothetical protein [Brachymonas sp.]
MTFKDFAINYLNPFYLFQRFWLLCAAGGCLAFSLGAFSPVQSKLLLIVLVAIGSTVAIRRSLRNYPILANIVMPFVMVCVGVGLLSTQTLNHSWPLLVTCIFWSTACLLAWNAIRPWGGGISMRDLGQKSEVTAGLRRFRVGLKPLCSLWSIALLS